MALDGIFLHSLLTDLKNTLINLKIDKINQPEKDEIVLSFRKNRQNIKLMLSSSPTFPRIHFITGQKPNPLTAPMFLMVLRKYLVGGTINEIIQKDGDRIVIFKIEATDELGFNSIYSLIVEIMGRHSNITLVRDRDNKVMDLIKHISPDINSYRVLSPGVSYVFAPSSLKINPFDFTEDYLNYFIKENNIEMNSLFFSNTFTGISKPLSIDLFNKYSNLQNCTIYKFVKDFITSVGSSSNYSIYTDKNGLYKDFHCVLLSSYDKNNTISYSSPSKMLEDFYSIKDKQERLLSKSANLQKLIHVNIERCNKKSKILNENINDAKNKEDFKIKGDLLASYIYNIKQGDESVEVVNFYLEEPKPIIIKIDKNKTPSENIQRFYHKYSKLKKSETWAIDQLEKNGDELKYLNSVLTNILNVDNYNDIDSIKDELKETGYIKNTSKKNEKKKKSDKPLHFISSTGKDIYVGKNNIQNDYLSLKFAHRNDTWLHTKEIPGSHVIIKSQEIDEDTLHEAGVLAAYYSKGKNSSNVPVDYTLVRNLKKPNGAKPGMVIYFTNKTLYIDPQEYFSLKVISKN